MSADEGGRNHTFLLVSLGKRHLAVILQVEPLDAAPHQILPAGLHGGPQEAGVQRGDLAYKARKINTMKNKTNKPQSVRRLAAIQVNSANFLLNNSPVNY